MRSLRVRPTTSTFQIVNPASNPNCAAQPVDAGQYLCTVVFAWGGHLAESKYWDIHAGGLASGAASNPGADFHMRLQSIDTDSTGQRDRSMQSSAISAPPDMTTHVSSGLVTPGTPVTDTANLSGSFRYSRRTMTLTSSCVGRRSLHPIAQREAPRWAARDGDARRGEFAPVYWLGHVCSGDPTTPGVYCFRAVFRAITTEPLRRDVAHEPDHRGQTASASRSAELALDLDPPAQRGGRRAAGGRRRGRHRPVRRASSPWVQVTTPRRSPAAATPGPTVTYHIAGPFSAPSPPPTVTPAPRSAPGRLRRPDADGFRSLRVWAVAPANANNEAATSTCGSETLIVPQNKPSIVTHLHNAGSDGLVGGTGTAADTDLSDGDSVAIGTSIYDTATVTGAATPNPTVTYHIAGPFSGAFAATNCDAGTAIGTGANSDVQTLTDAGRYELWATTAANANNEAATSTCGSETLIVPLNKPSIVTHLHNAGSDGLVGGTGTAADTDLSDGDSVAIGTSIYDTATVTGAATPNPTVTYHIAGPFSGAFAATNCDAGTAIGTGANSDVQTLTDAGRYELWATTAANANNEAATSTCGSETLIVPLNKPSIVTHLHNAGSDGLVGGTGTAADTDLSDGDSVAIGTSIYDTATVTGAATPNPTVTYHIAGPFSGAFAATNCDAGTAIGTGANSDVQTLTDAGRYELWATTAANANNEAATSTCGSETLIVPLNKPSIVTHLHNAGSDGLVGGTGTAADTDLSDGDSVAIGTSIYDTATVTGAATPNPTVTYHIAGPFSGAFAATNCDAGTAIGTGANSDVQTLTDAGRYELWATTAANANNEAATSTCGSETSIVPPNKPSIVTHLHNAGSDGLVGGTGTAADTDLSDGDSVAIGTSIYDTATVTGAATPNPTVTYHIAGPFSGAFAATNCDAGTAIGTGANSDVQTLTDAGRYELWATTAANANNEAATSTCGSETLNVARTAPRSSTHLQNAGSDGLVGPAAAATPTSPTTTRSPSAPRSSTPRRSPAAAYADPDRHLLLGRSVLRLPSPPPTVTPAPRSARVRPPTSRRSPIPVATSSGRSRRPTPTTTRPPRPVGPRRSTWARTPRRSRPRSRTPGPTALWAAAMTPTSTTTPRSPSAPRCSTPRRSPGRPRRPRPSPTTWLVRSRDPFAATDCDAGTAIGTGAASDVKTLTDSGRYEFWAVAAANANNNAATSTCGSETVNVGKNSPSISTQVKNAGADGLVGGGDDTNINDNASVAIGTKVFDTSTITGAASPAQTVTYYMAGPFSDPFAATDCDHRHRDRHGCGLRRQDADRFRSLRVLGGRGGQRQQQRGHLDLWVRDGQRGARTRPSISTQVKNAGADGLVGGGDDTNIRQRLGRHRHLRSFDTSTITGAASPAQTVTYYMAGPFSALRGHRL